MSDYGRNRMRAGRVSFWNVKVNEDLLPNFDAAGKEKQETENSNLEDTTKTNDGHIAAGLEI